MPLFSEIDLSTSAGGLVSAVAPDGVAAELGIQPGDEVLAVNGQAVDDVIDVMYHAAEEDVELTIRRDGQIVVGQAVRAYGQSLGIEFEHPTFDVDIRRCNNLCEFCFVLQMAPRFRRTLYIKDDDYRYSFLQGHFVTLTNLQDHDWWRIETMRLSPLYVSVHVTDQEQRRAFLRNPSAPDIMDQLKWLVDRGIEVHTQLVVAPGVNDGRLLARSIADLATLWPGVRSVSVVPVGLTRHHKYGLRTHNPDEAASMLDYLHQAQERLRQALDTTFIYPSDEWYLVARRPIPDKTIYEELDLRENGLGMVRHFLDEWTSVKEEIAVYQNDLSRDVQLETARRVTLVTGTLFESTLRTAAEEFSALTGTHVDLIPVVNRQLGESITAAGLLMGSDILEQLADVQLGSLLLLPRLAFDHPDGVSLDDLSPLNIASRLGITVILADTMGDVWDAVTGRSQSLHRPSPDAS